MTLNLRRIRRGVDIKRLFDHFDDNGDGHIDSYEMENICEACGLPRSYQRLNQILGRQIEGSQYYKFEQFIKILDEAQNDYTSFLRRIFYSLDNDRSNSLSYNEIGNLCCILGFDVPRQQLFNIIDKYDNNHSGKLELNEFIRFFVDLERRLE